MQLSIKTNQAIILDFSVVAHNFMPYYLSGAKDKSFLHLDDLIFPIKNYVYTKPFTPGMKIWSHDSQQELIISQGVGLIS